MAQEARELFAKLSDPTKDPIQVIWDHFYGLWSEGAKRVQSGEWRVRDYYEKCGREGSIYERRLEMIFFEAYEYLLQESKKKPKLPTLFPEKIPIVIIMDSMSLREAILLIEEIKSKGYIIEGFTYDSSAAPSETEPYREKNFGVSTLTELRRKKEFNTVTITHEKDLEDLKPIKGPTLFWSSFPDNLLEESSLNYKSIYEKTRKVLDSFLELKPEHLILSSDHGYLAESERWGLPSKQNKLLQRTFKSTRWILKNKLDAAILKWILELPREASYFVADEKCVYIRGRYMWMTRGKLPASFHGGISPMEVLTPFILLRRQGL